MQSIIPVSVLIEICKAIEGDEQAMGKAAEVAVPIIPPFSRKLSKVIMHISDVDVRRWALNEVKGVDYEIIKGPPHDHDNPAP